MQDGLKCAILRHLRRQSVVISNVIDSSGEMAEIAAAVGLGRSTLDVNADLSVQYRPPISGRLQKAEDCSWLRSSI